MKLKKVGKLKAILFGMFLISALIFTGGITLAINYLGSSHQDKISLNTADAYSYFGPYTINGDSGWDYTKNTFNWCTGSGTAGDPYIIENVTFNGNGLLVNYKSVLTINSTYKFFIIRNCTFTNSSINFDVTNEQFSAGIYLSNVQNGTIFNNTIKGNSIGIYSDGLSKNITITENNFINNNATAIYLQGANFDIADNKMILSGIRIPVDPHKTITRTNSKSHTIPSSNTLDGKTIYYVVNQSWTDETALINPGQVIVVNTNYSSFSNLDIEDGSAAFQLLYSNHNDISNNDFTFVDDSYDSQALIIEGCYNTTVVGNNISNNLVGISVGNSDQTVISGNDLNYNFYCGVRGYRILPGGDNNTIKNNNLVNNFIGIYLTLASKWIVQGNDIESNSTIGINIDRSDHCQIIGNTLNSDGIGETKDISVGIVSTQITSSSISNEIIGNNISKYYTGIKLLAYNEDFNISLNNLTNNIIYGILVNPNNYNITIHENNINNNGNYSIYLLGSNFCTISNNNASYNNKSGIYVVNSNNTDIINNNVYNNSEYGIYLDQSANCKINYNTLGNNTICIGVHQKSCPGLEAVGNTCSITLLDTTGGGGGGPGNIPGYEIFFIIGIIGVLSAIILKRRKQHIRIN